MRMNKNWMPCIDLTTHLKEDKLPQQEKAYKGFLTVDTGEYKAKFVETPPVKRGKRGRRVFSGQYLTAVYRKEDKSMRLYMQPLRLGPCLRPDDVCIGMMRDMRAILAMPLEEMDAGGASAGECQREENAEL